VLQFCITDNRRELRWRGEGTVMTDWDQVSAVLETLDIPMFVVDRTGTVSIWNRALQQSSGLVAPIVCQHLLSDFLESSQPWEDAFRNVFFPNEHEVPVKQNGSLCSVRLRSMKRVHENDESRVKSQLIRIQVAAHRAVSTGEVIGAVGIVSFVSPDDEHQVSVEAEGATIEDATRQADITLPATSATNHDHQTVVDIETACSPMFGLDALGRICTWNGEMTNTTGVAPGACIGKDFVKEYVVPSYQEGFWKTFLSVVSTGVGRSHFELEVQENKGRPKCLLLSINAVRDQCSGASNGVICLAHDVTESTESNRAVVAVASELRQLIDNANAPIFGCDTMGNINEWNDMTAQITGFAKEDVVDCSLIDTFIAPYMKDSVQEMLRNSLLGEYTPNFDLDLCTKLGDIRHLLVNATTRRDADNNIVGVVAVAQDVTEAVLRDRAVAGMAFELRQLIDTANAPIFGCDVDFNVNEWNRRTEEITGFLKEEAFGLPLVSTFITPCMHGKVQEILLAALQGNETSNYELEVISKSGEPRLLLVNATTRRDPEGNVVGGTCPLLLRIVCCVTFVVSHSLCI
jgi:PAS domain S-box-containing protein